MMDMPLTLLGEIVSIIGVGVAAVSGALLAGRRQYDLVGVTVLALITGAGGGTLRDVLMDRYPVFWVAQPHYLIVIGVAAAGTVVYTRFRRPPWNALLVADAGGLAYFTIFGATLVEQRGLSPLVAIVMGAITGAAGGVLRDVVAGRTPLLFRRREPLYSTASVAGTIAYLISYRLGLAHPAAAGLGMVVVAAVRLGSIRWGWHLPTYSLRHKHESLD